MVSLPITLPPLYSSVVSQGEVITSGQIIATKPKSLEERINLAEAFHESPEKIRKYLKKNPGDTIIPGDIIAKKETFLGTPQKVVSNVTGTVLRFERDSGTIILQKQTDENEKAVDAELISPLAGTITMCNNEQIVISVTGTVFAAKKGSGTRAQAEVLIIEPLPQQKGAEIEHILLEQIHPGCEGKIIVGTEFARDVLIKATVINVAGIIGTHITDEDMKYLLERHITIPVLEIEQDLYKKLFAYHGKKLLLDGTVGAIIPIQ